MQALKDAIPKIAFQRSTPKSLLYTSPIFTVSAVLFFLSRFIDSAYLSDGLDRYPPFILLLIRWTFWLSYWALQGIAWAGLWTIGHECDHNNLSPHSGVNHVIGFLCHTWLFLPYFSWRITHLRHHSYTGSLENDEVYVPYTRSAYRLPPLGKTRRAQYREAFEESPIFELSRLVIMQFFGMHTYLTCNTTGSKRYPAGANHWIPSSGLFSPEQRSQVLASNLGILGMLAFVWVWACYSSFSEVCKVYIVPFLFANHWIVAMTFLQHSCPTVPFYRKEAWNKARGSLSTIDRPFLGWVGLIFFLGLNHYHTTHHLFSTIPFYNLPMAHKAIRPLLGDMYNYDSTGVFWALKRSFTECIFVEDEGSVLFYKNKLGMHKRSMVIGTAGGQAQSS